MSPPDIASHNRTHLSAEPEATREASGENVTEYTELRWPSSLSIEAPNIPSHGPTKSSKEPDASRLPSDENTMDKTESK
jgi:hypothetical protein